EPVEVFKEPLTARIARWARRHKPQVVGLATLLVSAVVALAVSTVLVLREEARTDQQRRKAEANFQTALQAVNEMLTEVAEEQLAEEPQMEMKRHALLAKAQAYYTQFLEEKRDDLSLRKETGLAYKRLGDINRLLGRFGQAEKSYKQAIEVLSQLA